MWVNNNGWDNREARQKGPQKDKTIEKGKQKKVVNDEDVKPTSQREKR